MIHLAVLVLTAGTQAPQHVGPPLDPTEYLSPSGTCLLQVLPSDRDGAGHSRCRLLRDGEQKWEVEIPWTLWEAVVTDEGWCAGYAYAGGYGGYREAQLVLGVIDPFGTARQVTRIERQVRAMHAPSHPRGAGVFLGPGESQAAIRVDVWKGEDEWWTLDFAQGGSRVGVPVVEPALRAVKRRPLLTGYTTPLPPEIPEVALEPKGTIALDAEPPAPDPWRLKGWAITEGGRPERVLIGDGGQYRVEELDLGGGVVASQQGTLKGWIRRCARLPDGSWLGVVRHSEKTRCAVWILGGGLEEPRHLFDTLSRVEELTVLPDGTAVILTKGSLRAYGRTVRALWRVGSSLRDRTKLFNPKDVTATSDGRVAVVDPSTGRIQLFTSDGAFDEAIELESLLPGKYHYLCRIAPAPGGELLVYDSHEPGSLWRVDPASCQVVQVDLRLSDGRESTQLLKTARYGPDARLWACLDERFIRFDDSGVADLEVGAAPAQLRLHDPGAIAVAPSGSIFVFDEKTAVVHAFDPRGATTDWLEPGPTDFRALPSLPHLSIASDGRVFAYVDDRLFHSVYVEFDPRGNRIGAVQRPGRRLVFHPQKAEAWSLVFEEAVRLGGGGEELSRVERRIDGRWLGKVWGMGVSPDGRFAIVDSRKEGLAVTLFGSDGTPLATHAIPRGVYYHRIAYGSGWIALYGFGPRSLLVRESDGAQRYFRTRPDDAGIVDLLCSPDGSELWIFDRRERVIHRYPWPDEG